MKLCIQLAIQAKAVHNLLGQRTFDPRAPFVITTVGRPCPRRYVSKCVSMRLCLIFSLAIFATALNGCGSDSQAQTVINFETLVQGDEVTGIEGQRFEVIGSQTGFNAFWLEFTSSFFLPDQPAVDFADHYVTALVTGGVSGSGQVEITSVEDMNPGLRVEATLEAPCVPEFLEESGCAGNFVQPYHLVSVPLGGDISPSDFRYVSLELNVIP